MLVLIYCLIPVMIILSFAAREGWMDFISFKLELFGAAVAACIFLISHPHHPSAKTLHRLLYFTRAVG
jgi:hypothetical protein